MDPSSALAEAPNPAAPSRQPRSIPIFFIITLAILIAGAIWLYPLWQQSRADNFASQAQDLFDQNNFIAAEVPLKAALQIRPHDPRFLRLAARLYNEERNPAAIAYYNSLFRLPEANDRDRYKFVGLAMNLRKPEIARPVLEEMLSRSNVSPHTYFYAAKLEEYSRRLPKAITFARKAVAKDPSIPDISLLLAKLLLETGGDTNIVEAKEILFGIGTTDPAARLFALRMLALTKLSQSEIQQLVRWLKTISLPTLDDIFLGYELLYRANPSRLESIGREAASRFTSARPEEQVALGTWLNRHRLFNQTLLSLKPDPQLRPVVSSVYLDALIGAEKWTEALQFLEKAEKIAANQFAIAGYTRLSTNPPTAQAAQTGLLRARRNDSVKMPSQ